MYKCYTSTSQGVTLLVGATQKKRYKSIEHHSHTLLPPLLGCRQEVPQLRHPRRYVRRVAVPEERLQTWWVHQHLRRWRRDRDCLQRRGGEVGQVTPPPPNQPTNPMFVCLVNQQNVADFNDFVNRIYGVAITWSGTVLKLRTLIHSFKDILDVLLLSRFWHQVFTQTESCQYLFPMTQSSPSCSL